MRKSLILTYLLGLFVFTMCTSKPSVSNDLADRADSVAPEQLIEVDLCIGDYAQQDLYLQDIADVRYVPLETSDQSILSTIRRIALRDDRIIITDFSDQVVVFDSTGRYLSKISHKGPGPHQYHYIAASAVDFDKHLVYIEDLMGIKAYDFDGYFVKSSPKPDYTSSSMLYVCDSTRLIAYYETQGLKEDGDTLLGNYFFIDTETGARTRVGIDIPEPASNTLMQYRIVSDGMVSSSKSIPINTMLKTDSKVIISDYVLPSVFEYSANGLNHIIERQTGNEWKWLTSVFLLSDPYIMFRAIRTTGDESLKTYKSAELCDFIYNCKTQTISEGDIYNRDIEVDAACSIEGWGNDLPKNTIVEAVSVEALSMLNERGKLSGPLKEIADTIDLEANSILMIATIKSK